MGRSAASRTIRPDRHEVAIPTGKVLPGFNLPESLLPGQSAQGLPLTAIMLHDQGSPWAEQVCGPSDDSLGYQAPVRGTAIQGLSLIHI